MMGTVSAATMTSQLYDYQDIAGAAVEAARERFGADVRLHTPWQVDPVKEVVQLSQLRPNWDGYGTGPVDVRTATAAIRLIQRIASLGFDDLPAPAVAPTAGAEGQAPAGIQLSWSIGARRFVFALFPEGTVDYLKCEAGEPFEGGAIALSMPGKLRELIGWVSARC